MGELWRSQEMHLIQLYVQVEAIHDTIDELAKVGQIQFRDLNPHINPFQRNFVGEIRRLDEINRILSLFEDSITTYNKQINEEKLDKKNLIKIKKAPETWYDHREHLDEMESKFEDMEKTLSQITNHATVLESNYVQLKELKFVLEKDETFYTEGESESRSTGEIVKEGVDLEDGVRLRYVSGVINRDQFFLFERILWRVMKGNLLMNFSEIEEKIQDIDDHSKVNYVEKNAFIIFFPGKGLEEKVRKICQSLNAHVYQTPTSRSGRKDMLKQINERIEESEVLKEAGIKERRDLLINIAHNLSLWQNYVRKEKAIYHTMTLFNYDVGRQCLIGEGWCPTAATDKVQIALRTAREKSGALVPSILNVVSSEKEDPPTYFKTNKFTSAFQSIVDSYGVARYQEVNPAVLTIITFPFEFGVMFGDVGHGFLLLIFALIMIKMESRWEGKKINEMFEITYGGRYVLLLMALFSIYQGALYNEIFSLPMDFGSNWVIQIGPGLPNNTFEPRYRDWAYPFGVDPVWKGASNELLYYNSLKMKMSIIIGVTQMTVGLFLHFLNGIYFRKWLDVFFEFIPRVVFLLSIFGYLCFMIVYKWNVDYYGQDIYNRQHNLSPNETVGPKAGTSQAPVILNELIYMFLPSPSNSPFYPGQPTVQTILVILAFVSIPIMMLPKPFIMRWQYNKAHPKNTRKDASKTDDFNDVNLDSSEDPSGNGKEPVDEARRDKEMKHVAGPLAHGGHEEEFEFGEIFVHQILETIEFVLGSVSHTASYLRLWALSLAHSELATVFWDKIFGTTMIVALPNGNFVLEAILLFIGFSVWWFATMLVILFMESLSAFLHALRLHWVEFQSKFYKGDGHQFVPLSYQLILSDEEQEI